MRRLVLLLAALLVVIMMSGCAYLGTMGNLYVSSPYGLTGITSNAVVHLQVRDRYHDGNLFTGLAYVYVRGTNWRLSVNGGTVNIPVPGEWNSMTIIVEYYDRYGARLPDAEARIDLRTREHTIYRDVWMDSRPY